MTCILTNFRPFSFKTSDSPHYYSSQQYHFAINREYKLLQPITFEGFAVTSLDSRSTDTSFHFWYQSHEFRYWFVVGFAEKVFECKYSRIQKIWYLSSLTLYTAVVETVRPLLG